MTHLAPPPAVSFEFFPPKTPALEVALEEAVTQLAPLNPAFVSVTYGAGGSTRARTHNIVCGLQQNAGLSAAAHLTCIGATREEVDAVARGYKAAGINHIVALRGDPPEGAGAAYVPHPGGYAYASDLVEGLLKIAPFEISVAAYPEVHPQAHSSLADLENLKRKVDAGAVRAITQFFFDNQAFLRFRDRAFTAGIMVPIIPGIMPISNFARTQEFARHCGARIPDEYPRLFAGHDEAPALVRRQTAVDVATEQCQELRAHGVQHFHFYTLNRAELVKQICLNLGVAAG